MPKLYVVVDQLDDWAPYHASPDVITFDDYLRLDPAQSPPRRTRVINLCQDSGYLGKAYYCALMAEARGHRVLPSVRDLNDAASGTIETAGVRRALDQLDPGQPGETRLLRAWFGQCSQDGLGRVARRMFEACPCPLLEARLRHEHRWEIENLRVLSLSDLIDDAEQEAFGTALERFSARLWRQPRRQRVFRYDLAILADGQERLPPSDRVALKRFVKAARDLRIAAEIIGPRDLVRIGEYDALFIRATTSVDHFTYRFARRAEREGLTVIDDPMSILRCTNKVYLAELLQRHDVPIPKTRIVSSADQATVDDLVATLGIPLVLKVPDGSFSIGVSKVNSAKELSRELERLFEQSAVLLAQEYLFTDYDWRIGVLNGEPLYACRYFMVRGHWQIYQHGKQRSASGDFETLPIAEAPRPVVEAALRAADLIGNGLYGVDLKQKDRRVAVIEVNDNPSIESGVEDKILGRELYDVIMREFLRRMEARTR
ncbi:MAG: RimK family protein [Xanthomonadales bacterium]|nr:RimK family protein [Xanthomonadales bacterium]